MKNRLSFLPQKALVPFISSWCSLQGKLNKNWKKNYYYSPLKEIPYGLIMYLKYFFSGWLLFLWLFVTSVVFSSLHFQLQIKLEQLAFYTWRNKKNKSGGKFRGPLFYMTGFTCMQSNGEKKRIPDDDSIRISLEPECIVFSHAITITRVSREKYCEYLLYMLPM